MRARPAATWSSWLLFGLMLAPFHPARGQDRAGQATEAAGPVDSSYLGLLQWRLIGPSRGGRSLAVAGDPRSRLTFYLGSTGGGVWKTEDGGIGWHNISDGYFHTGSVGAIAVAASDPNVIYVGMGESCFRGDASYGDGVYRSTDGGKTWTNVGLVPTRHIARIRVDPTNADVAYVAAFGDGFGPSPDRGVYRTRDGGRTWEKVLYRSDQAGAIDLVMDPQHPQVLYASLLEFQRYPWGIRSAGPATGIFKTTDGGDTWTELTSNPGLPAGPKGRIGLALSPANPSRIWAIIDAELGKKGVYRSDDAGATWQRLTDFAELTQRPWYYHHIFADPKDPETVYVLNIDAWKSTDGGRSFTEFRAPHGDHHDLWIDPADPSRMIEANDGGGTVSFDGGSSWSTEMNQPTAQLYHVTVDNRFPYNVYGAQQDEGSIALPSRSDFRRITQDQWFTVGGGESGYIAVNPDDPDIVYAGEHHWLERYDGRLHARRDISPWPENNYGWGDRDIRYRVQWTYPVVLSPHDRHTLYAAAQVVFKTTNEGQSWEVISPDLTRHDSTRLEPTPSYGHETPGPYWGPITRDNTAVEWYGTVFALAESPVTTGVLWAGSDDGYIQVSRDGGKTWTNVTPRDLPEFSRISIIDPSPYEAGAAYVAANRYQLQDDHPYLYKTTDYGATWTRITDGIPEGDFTRVIREDPGRRGLLYAGTETGVYVSFDDGGQWQSLRLNLPVTPVHDLMVKDGDLVAATHGRSFWILDNVALFRQLDAAVLRQAVYLFRPRRTVRHRAVGAEAGTSAAAGTEGRNPPDGVVVLWHTGQGPGGPATLTFLDAAGQEIRSFHATGNRFVWDMRYPGANVLPGTTLHGRAGGPLAPPGSYQVRLTMGGQSYSQPFEIVKDPRLPYSDQDLAEQFKFQVAVRDKLSEVHDVVREIRSMRAEAEEAVARRKASRKQLTALNDRLYPIEERLSQYRARATQDLTNYPNGLDDKLVQLMDFAGQADGPPTKQMYDLLADLSGRLDGWKRRLEAVKAGAWKPFATK